MTLHAQPATPHLAAALEYIRRGLAPVPIPHGEKGPVVKDWPNLRVDASTAAIHFGGDRQNIGICMGPASAGLTDVDLDCAEAIALAPYFLPQTDAIFGRPSKPSSHYLYRTDLADTERRATFQFRDPMGSGEHAMLLEVRIGGGSAAQTVFPPSIHPSGERIEWMRNGQPARLPGQDLLSPCRRLAAAALLA